MPPNGSPTVTTSEETADKLTELVVEPEPESLADATDYAADPARDPKTLSDAELAHLLYRRLTD